MKMESVQTVLEEAGEAVLHVVKAFNYFRKDNPRLAEFFHEIESLVEARCGIGKFNSNLEKEVKSKFDKNCNFDALGSINHEKEPNPETVSCNAIVVSQKTAVEDEKSPEERVFAIHFLLENILGELNTWDLNTCRCVSPVWNSTATKLLLRQNAVVCDNLENPALQNFLINNGWQIKHLNVKVNVHNSNITPEHGHSHDPPHCYDQFASMKYFKELLTHQVPNLERLVLGQFPPLWENEDDLSQLFPENTTETSNFLPKLKSIHFLNPAPSKVCDDLLRAARNIDSIGLSAGCDSMLPWLMESNKVNLLKSLEIELDDDNTELYDTFSESEFDLKLKKFVISIPMEDPEEWLDVVRIILNFLKSSSLTLEEFHSQPHADLFDFEFPLMPNLKRIRILSSIMVYGKFFTDDLKLSEVFPSLESLESEVEYDVKMYLNSEWDWDVIFGATTNDIHKTMKNISFTCGPPALWLENFARMFPNLTTIKVGFIDDFPRACLALWKLTLLETLECGVELKDHQDDKNSYPAIDAGFTGFSNEECLSMYELSRFVTAQEVTAKRENPSILDSKCLRKLHFKIHDECPTVRDCDTLKIMSHVTGAFAFRFCSELNVSVSITAEELGNVRILKNALSPILPYVDSITYDSQCF